MPMNAAKEFEMGFIYSTDDLIKERLYARRNFEKCKAREFIAFNISGRYTGKIIICARLARQACLMNKVILGYDAENNELIIKPSVNGNLKCNKTSESIDTMYVSARNFMFAVGFTDETMPYGRYEARVEDDGNIHAYLNNPLPEDEQNYKRKRGGTK